MTRQSAVSYLIDHFRYNVMNSWNKSTSYACNVKFSRIIFPNKKVEDFAYDALNDEMSFFVVNEILGDFDKRYNWKYQAGFNGRSGGYIVMYNGGRRQMDYKTRCNKCFIPTWYEKEGPCSACNGGRLKKLTSPIYQTYTTGANIDQDEDFSEWDDDSIAERVALVMSFDKMCMDAVAAFIYYCEQEPKERNAV